MQIRLLVLAIAASGFGGRLTAQTIEIKAGAVPAVTLTAGTKLTVPVIVDISNAGSLNIATLNASFAWNATRLTFDSLRRAPGVSWTFVNNTANAASGVVSFNASSSVRLAATTTLANIYLTAKGSGGTRVVPSVASAASETAQSILSSLLLSSLDVCVQKKGRFGDTNRNDVVDIVDAQQLSRYTVGLPVVDVGAILELGDVNADGAVNIIDGQQVARFAVGFPPDGRVNVEASGAPSSSPTPTSITIEPAVVPSIGVGGSVQLSAKPWAGGTDLTGCRAVTWQTSNATVASVNNSGYVRGLAAGSATLTATVVGYPALTASRSVTVGSSPPPDPSGLRVVAAQRGIRIGAAIGAAMNYTGSAWTSFSTIFNREFSMATPENAMKHDAIHPSRTTYSFAAADAIVNFALANNQTVRGHTLIWKNQNASWLTSGNWTPAEMRTLLEEHVTTVVSRYRGKVAAWDVVNEPLCDNGALCGGLWQAKLGHEFIDFAFRAARAADPTVPLFINEYGIEWSGAKVNALYDLVSAALARGVPIDGVGFESHFAVGEVPSESELTANLARFSALGLKVHITELDVRIPLPATQALLDQQAADYRTVVRACLAVLACDAIVVWGFSDKESWIPSAFPGWGAALPLDVNYQPKPAYNAMKAAFSGG